MQHSRPAPERSPASARFPGMTEKKPRRRKGARRLKIVSGLIEGKSMAEVAREEGVSRQKIAKQASTDEVRRIIAALVNAEFERIEAQLRRVLEVIDEAFEASLSAWATTVIIELGPDHYARLTAVKRFIKLITAGRPVPKAPELPVERRTLTLDEIDQICRKYAQPGPPPATEAA